MDGSTPRANSVSVDFGSELHVWSLTCEKSHTEHKECACSSVKEASKIKSQGVLDICSFSEKGDVIAPYVGIAAGSILHVQDTEGQLCGAKAISDRDDTITQKEMNMCQGFCLSFPLDAKMQKCLNKCATFPSSTGDHSCSLFIEGGEGSPPSTEAQDQCLYASKSPAYARSVSLPSSLELVSAMKGGRAQNGISLPTTELRVKWAADVYDPPATSMSHTVRSHHQRPRGKKKDNHKHKNNKGKSSRGSGSDRKHTNRRNTCAATTITDSLDARLQASGDRLVLERYNGKSTVEILEYPVSGHESKCGSSFLREALAKVHLSVAEAS